MWPLRHNKWFLFPFLPVTGQSRFRWYEYSGSLIGSHLHRCIVMPFHWLGFRALRPHTFCKTNGLETFVRKTAFFFITPTYWYILAFRWSIQSSLEEIKYHLTTKSKVKKGGNKSAKSYPWQWLMKACVEHDSSLAYRLRSRLPMISGFHP